MRCAIYTRKSADEARDSQHSTIETQRDLCEKYVASQAGSGWLALAKRYDDVGFSGGTLKRPALDDLLADIAAGLVDVVVIYKIDRLSRDLKDFFKLAALLEARGVTFVSVTQSFGTTDAASRLMLNVMLSVGQFEREVGGERTRDWVAAARQRGIWTSGPVPFGYFRKDGRLAPHPERAPIVRWAFGRLPRVKNFGILAHEMNEAGHRNRFGRTWDGRTIKVMITNRAYLGELTHKGTAILNTHEAIVSKAMWRNAQRAVTAIAAGKYGQMGAWQRSRNVMTSPPDARTLDESDE